MVYFMQVQTGVNTETAAGVGMCVKRKMCIRDRAEAPGDYLQRVIYAIMIYENFNRSTTQRWCENVLFCLGRRLMTLGIMQVSTTKFIHNAESVELGCRKIKESFQEYVKVAKKENYQG